MLDYLFQEEYDELLAETNSKKAPIKLSQIDKMWDEILDINTNKLLYGDTETPTSALSRLYIIEYYYFAMAVGSNLTNNLQLILKPLLISISNTALCIYKNVYDGFKYQAKVLLRNLYEQGLVFLNILLNKEKRLALKSASGEKNEYKIWKKYFTPYKMHKTIEDFEKSLGEAWSEDWHNRIYSDLSSYAHNDFLSFLVGAYFVPEDEEEEFKINICGCFADNVDNTLEQLNTILFFVGMNFLKIISSTNIDITKEMICLDEKENSDNRDFWNVASFLELLNRKVYLKLFWKSQENK